MFKYIAVLIFIALAWQQPAGAQTNKESLGKESFEEFRKGIKDDFFSFRNDMMKRYNEYLAGIWKNYNIFRGVKRDSVPKPRMIPVFSEDKPDKPDDRPEDIPGVDDIPEIIPENNPENIPEIIPENVPEAIPEPIPDSCRAVPAGPDKNIGKDNVPDKYSMYVDFYDMQLQMPDIRNKFSDIGFSELEPAEIWSLYCEKDIYKVLTSNIRYYADYLGLNDWFIFELVRCYSDTVFKDYGETARISLSQFIMVGLGYDVRVGLLEGNRLCLLVPTQQTTYNINYMIFNDHPYYVYYDKLAEHSGKEYIVSTYYMNDNTFKALNLEINRPLNIPYSSKKYYFSYGGIKLQGEINENIMPMLYNYPLTDLWVYQKSVINEEVRKSVISQIDSQLSGMPRLKAVNTLLQFVQSAFEYSTDQDLHGFEKPYFFEEMLYYPKCDCEDRSIFYSYLLRYVFGMNPLLVTFPGHASVGINLYPGFKGDYFFYKNLKYYISDPTYMEAVTGQCMPQYRKMTPKVEYEWE